MNDMFLGLVLVFIGSVLQGSWAVPMKYTKKWEWENMWMAYSILSMIVFNLLISMIFVPNLFEIYRAAVPSVLKIIGFGVVWGSGVVLFGLGLAAVGMALSYALMFGALLAVGAIVPMIVLHPAEILTEKGIVVILGVIISLIGIGIGGIAGMRKEKDQISDSQAEQGMSKISMKMGIIICIVAGTLISVVNIAFATSDTLINIAVTLGSSARYTGNIVWGILFSTGGVVNMLYCLYLMGKNKSGNNYKAPGTGKNWILIVVMAFIWIISFSFYGQGASKMGSWGPVIGWSMFTIIPIATANFWGMFLGEWKGVKRSTMNTMITALVVFLIAIVVFTYSGTL